MQELRRELQTAVDAGEGAEIRFGVGEVTLELEVAVAQEAGVEGGLKFWVVGEAKGSANDAGRAGEVVPPAAREAIDRRDTAHGLRRASRASLA